MVGGSLGSLGHWVRHKKSKNEKRGGMTDRSVRRGEADRNSKTSLTLVYFSILLDSFRILVGR